MNFGIKHGTAVVIIRSVSVFLPSNLSYSSGNHCLSLSVLSAKVLLANSSAHNLCPTEFQLLYEGYF